MRKAIVSEFVTLDGVMGSPEKWSFPYWSDEAGKFKFEELFAADALLLGSKTYEELAAAWPTMTDDEGFADRMNSLPKYVACTTLDDAAWNATIYRENIADEVSRLKKQPGQDILVFGSADLVQFLRQHGLIDEYRLMLFPVVVGSGNHLFREYSANSSFQLTDTKVLSTGVVVLTYRPAEEK